MGVSFPLLFDLVIIGKLILGRYCRISLHNLEILYLVSFLIGFLSVYILSKLMRKHEQEFFIHQYSCFKDAIGNYIQKTKLLKDKIEQSFNFANS